MKKNLPLKLALITLLLTLTPLFRPALADGGAIIPTDATQEDFLKAYKLAMYESYADMRFYRQNLDTNLFSRWGEFSIYWAAEGENKGSFILPEKVPYNYRSVTNESYDEYDWEATPHYSLQYKPNSKRVAIFRSEILKDDNTVTWGAIYFENLFNTYLYDNIYYEVNESFLDTNDISSATQLLIIPSFSLKGEDQKYYIDSVFKICPNIGEKIESFLQSGGTIYAEGNASYFIEKLGYLSAGAVDFDDYDEADYQTNLIGVNFNSSQYPIAFTEDAVNGNLYATIIPNTDVGSSKIIASTANKGYPACFLIEDDKADGGRILCNAGIPTIGGIKEVEYDSRQLQWSLNAIFYTWVQKIDVTRAILNEVPDTLAAGKNAVSYDRKDTFKVQITVRNLSDEPINSIEIEENVRDYFEFLNVETQGVTYEVNGEDVKFTGLNMPPRSEKVIVYRLATPEPDDEIHEQVDKYISWKTYIYVSYNETEYENQGSKRKFWKYRNYADMMFSAFLAADTDLNWKNFLGLYYQPFKVFMIMENKERTPALETKYVQYIPKDVPFYWSDKSINIPILKTPGGKFVDVLRGSNDEDNPEYDMDNDGNPDVWLDTASIYPKGYTIEEDSVYWRNPWEHLRSGNYDYYEDIDHDGRRAKDLDGDGEIDLEEAGDKIRVWKVTWDIGDISGYDYFDPYCYYEIWVDPPKLVNLSAAVGKAHGSLDDNYNGGMFYPYTPNIENADLNDTTWSHWMERDDDGNVIWKQLIYQRINNYQGFTFIDTAKTGYKLKPTDKCVGTVPQPHREFIAVLSLGGEEIDMEHYRPSNSPYSNLEYKTIFDENRKTPIRSTYTYWAPLPNPLQFEYLTNNFTITNDDGDTLKYLPANGEANLTFDVDASTEYSYYWIRNVGYDVDYNDSSGDLKYEDVEELGDGVFGYFVYDIPKGIGGYNIKLPKRQDGTYDIDAIVEIDGAPYHKWIDNPNTKDSIEIWEDPYQYHIYIPQVLIPPALDDDNFDGIDDWIDDRGDRFCSSTGFLHDDFMLDDGEDWLDYPEEPFIDDIYGRVDSGWYHGPDGEYGDDYFETLGKTHFKFHCKYEGNGKEGSVDISKGGWLVVEEIFGGSPWVIFSHVLTGYAKGVDYRLIAKPTPSIVKFGLDTAYIKYSIEDRNEPHYFDARFDPYRVSYGYGEATITTYAGGRDPCSLIEPSFNMSTIIDGDYNYRENVTLIPNADPDNPDLADYPKTVSGCFLEAKIEIMNGTDDNWINTTITPQIPNGLGNSEVVMSYVAYPRPLVPAKVDPATGEVIRGGDDLGSFRAGWRFNQPEDEVLIKMGNTLPLMQPSRRAYFVILFKIDENLENDVYDINFSISGTRKHYDESNARKKDKAQSIDINYEVPPLKFSVSDRNENGAPVGYEKIVVGDADLKSLLVETSGFFEGMGEARWSDEDVNYTEFDDLASLPSEYDAEAGKETIDLSQFTNFPNTDFSKFYILQKGKVQAYSDKRDILLSDRQILSYESDDFGSQLLTSGRDVEVTAVGPKLMNFKKIAAINGKEIKENQPLKFDSEGRKRVDAMVQVTNYGNDMAENVILDIEVGPYFNPIAEALPPNCAYTNNRIVASIGACVPGEKKRIHLPFIEKAGVCSCLFDTNAVIPNVMVSYRGNAGKSSAGPTIFRYPDWENLDLEAPDLYLYDLSANKEVLERGSDVRITGKVRNGARAISGAIVRFFAIGNDGDTLLIGEKPLDSLDRFQERRMDVYYAIEDSAEYVEFYASVESQDPNSEFCSQNNDRKLQIPMKGPDWIVEVKNYPNPMDYRTYISYYLTREMNSLKLTIYSFDGSEVAKFKDCPIDLGRNSIYWRASNHPKGTYIYSFDGIDSEGKPVTYSGRFVKD